MREYNDYLIAGSAYADVLYKNLHSCQAINKFIESYCQKMMRQNEKYIRENFYF